MMNKSILVLATLTTLVSCETAKEVTNDVTEEIATDLTSSTIDLDYMDKTIRPQDDFFQFSNGNWVKNNPVPSSESSWGSFNELKDANNEKIIKILEQAASSEQEKGSDDYLLGSYYSSYINMDARNSVAFTPIEDDLRMIQSINSKKDLVKIISLNHREGIGSLFSFGVGQDLKDVENNIAHVSQGGIGLPNRDYYFDEDKLELRNKYATHIAAMFRKLEIYMDGDGPKATAEKVVNFETQLASKMMTRSELRIPENTYNKMSRRDAIATFGAFDFETYIMSTGINSFDSLIVGQPDFLKQISTMVEEVSLEDWKSYLTWKLVNNYAGHLNQELVDLNFRFYGTTLRGTKEMKPISERAISEITGMPFSEVLGKAFVEKYYSEAAKDRVNEMVDNLLVVFKGRINNLDWMSSTTKKEALNKLSSIGRKLGYPDKWEDFSSLDFKADDYIHNLKQTAEYSYRKNIDKLDEPVNKDKWGMPAHMVNAYYHPLLNEIAFPAGIMQPPFFSDQYEDAVNYGRIGMVIGHEFTHGFDDMGSKFSADGNFKNWWTEEDRKLFEERTEKLGNTFSNFCPIDGHCVNPDLTMGENIADLGGLTMAYYAYAMTDEFKKGINKKGYTPAQRFFIGYAQLWKINYTDEALKNRIANDSHSPGMYRVNGPLMNCPEFFDAFNVLEEDPMRNSAEKISKIW